MKAVPLNLQPDIESSWEYSPGALVSVNNMVPLRRGSYASFSVHITENSLASYALTTYPVIAGIVRLPANTVRAFAFNKASIYELTSTSAATDRSKGGGYSASTTTWTWTMFGAACIATNKLDNVQYSTSGAFADMSGSPPKAQLVVSQLGFVMLLNFNDGTDTPDGWYCSPLENPTGSWTTSLSTQCAKGRLYDTPGPITAAVALRDSIIAFKADSIYIGDYYGDTTNGIIWGWRLISDKVGTSSVHGVAVLNDKCYFVHRTNVYEFDGAAVRPIGDAVAASYVNNIVTAGSIGSIQACVDQAENLVFWLFPSSSVFNAGLCYNVASGKFGSVSPLATADSGTLGTNYYATCVMKANQTDLASFIGVSTVDYGTMLLMGKLDGSNVGLWNGKYPGGTLGYISSVSAGVTTGSLGEGIVGSRVLKVRPRFRRYVDDDQNTDPSGTIYGSHNEADVIQGTASHTAPLTWNLGQYCLDGVIEDRYINAAINFKGPVEISGLAIELVPGATK